GAPISLLLRGGPSRHRALTTSSGVSCGSQRSSLGLSPASSPVTCSRVVGPSPHKVRLLWLRIHCLGPGLRLRTTGAPDPSIARALRGATVPCRAGPRRTGQDFVRGGEVC